MWWGALIAALTAFLKAVFGVKEKAPEITGAEHALAAKQREAEILAAPLPADDELARIVHRHQRDKR